MHTRRPCGPPSPASPFFDELGYARPYPPRASFSSLNADVRALILQATSPETDLESEKDHLCSRSYPCPILRPALRPFLRLALVNKEWQTAVLRICDRLAPSLWTRKFEGNNYSEIHYKAYQFLEWQGVVGGRFRVTKEIEIDYDHNLAVLIAEDLGTEEGCKQTTTVVVKVYLGSPGTYREKHFKSEWLAYKTLSESGSPLGFARLVHRGTTFHSQTEYEEERDYLAVEYLGVSLNVLMGVCPDGKFPLRWALAVGIQLLNQYEVLYKLGLAHNGCKPANICLPPASVKNLLENDPARGRLYLIDFDMTLDVRHRGWDVGGWSSNITFASRFWHFGSGCSYNTDMESLAYTLVFLQKGELPWERYGVGGSTPTDKLCEGLDPVFAELVRWARGLVHGEDPQHARLRARFAAAWVRAGFGDALGHIDWWAEYEPLVQAHEAKERARAERAAVEAAARRERAAAEAAERLPYRTPLPPSPPPEPALPDDLAETLAMIFNLEAGPACPGGSTAACLPYTVPLPPSPSSEPSLLDRIMSLGVVCNVEEGHASLTGSSGSYS